VFLHGAECWALSKEDEHSILTAEIGWLRKLPGVSRRQRKKNKDTKSNGDWYIRYRDADFNGSRILRYSRAVD